MAQQTNTKKRFNDPDKVDSFIGHFIIMAAGGYLFVTLTRNIEPYGHTLADLILNSAIGGWVSDSGFLGIASWLIGLALFTAVQIGEVWPLIIILYRSAGTKGAKLRRRLLIAASIAVICFAIDLYMCLNHWPPLNLPGELTMFQVAQAGAFSWGMIHWGNIVTLFITLFGGGLFVWGRYHIQRAL